MLALGEAEEGKSALKAFAELRPEAVLLDIIMPGMDGTEAGAVLKEDFALKHIPVIFLTALVEGADH